MNKKDYREAIVSKLECEKDTRAKLLVKRKSLDEKIQKSENTINKLQEDIENYDIKCMVKIIKAKGYSIASIKDQIECGTICSNDLHDDKEYDCENENKKESEGSQLC